MHAVILAGGRGTRLGQLTLDLPKPMVPVAGRPFLEHVLDSLAYAGIDGITLSVGYKAQAIQTHFGATYRGMTLRYAVEEQPLGTGGAIAKALQRENSPALVLNGDTLLKIDFRALVDWYLEDPVPVAMVLREVADVARYGAVIVDNEHVAGYSEKGRSGPGLINAGVYVVQPGVFREFNLSGSFGLETDLLQRHCRELRPRAYVTRAYFIDIGIPADLERARTELGSSA
jgi:D-glycero-alpha-D-manno-heptose 1-phosphate guanylyltransferase